MTGMGPGQVQRYKGYSSRYRACAVQEMRQGNWNRAEEFFWGSLVGVVKAVASSRGVQLIGDDDARRYLNTLAQEAGDRWIGDAFDQLSNFSAVSERLRDSKTSLDRLYHLADRVSDALDRLWKMLPPDEEDVE